MRYYFAVAAEVSTNRCLRRLDLLGGSVSAMWDHLESLSREEAGGSGSAGETFSVVALASVVVEEVLQIDDVQEVELQQLKCFLLPNWRLLYFLPEVEEEVLV